MDCLFCKIVNKEIPGKVVYENDHVLAFLDINPRSTGHSVVIPKVHAKNISELPDGEVQPFFAAVKHVVGLIKESLSPDGFTLGMNYGEVSGQEVDHLHFHIMPRWHGDEGKAIQSVVGSKVEEDLDAIAEKIRNV